MRENELGQGFDDGIEPADRRSDEHLCHFFGTYDVAWIPENRVVHFNDAPPDLTKKSRTKPFLRAIAEARQWRIDKVDPEGFNGCSNFQTDLSDDGEDEGPGYGYGADHPVSVATQAAALVAVSFPRFSPQWLAAQKRKWKLQVLAGKRRKLSEPSPADGFRSPQHSEESTRGMALPLATAPKAGSNTPHNSKTHPPPPATGKPKPARPPPPPTTGKPKLAPPPPPPATGTPKPAKAPPPLAATVKAKASAIQGKKPTDGSLGGAKRMRKLPISVSVFTLKDGTSNVYKSGAEAERALQIPRGTVPNVLAGKSEATYKGMYTFRKVERPGSAQPAGTKAQGAAAHTPGAAAATDKTAAAGVAPGSATPQQHGVPDNAGGVQGLAHNNAGAGDTPPIKKASPAQGATGTPGEKLAAKQNERARLVHGWVKQRLASGASIVGKQEDRDDFTARTGVGVSSFNKWMRKAGLQYNQSAGCWGKPKSTLGGAHTSKPDPSLPSTPGLAPGTVAALGTKATPSTAQAATGVEGGAGFKPEGVAVHRSTAKKNVLPKDQKPAAKEKRKAESTQNALSKKMKIGKKNKDDKKNKAGQKDDGGTGETKDGAKKKDRVWDKNKGGKLGTPLKNKHSSSAATPGKNGKAKPGTEATPGMGKVARDSSATSSASPLVRPRKPAIRFSKGWLKRKKKTWKKKGS